MAADVLRELNKKRGSVKGRLTLFIKFVSSLHSASLSESQLHELTHRFNNAKSLLNEFNSIQSSIEELVSESELVQQLDCRESFENSYYSIITEADKLLTSKDDKSSENNDINFKCKSSLIKLPTITLPSFDGSYNNWLEFRDTYLSMIHQSKKLDDIQKFHYLRSSLSGSASQVIKSLEFSFENYTIAWDLLNRRYNDSDLLVHNHVKALFSIQSLSKESSFQVRKLIDSILKNIRALKSLGEPTEHWDTLIIFIIVSKLDVAVEKEWEQFKRAKRSNSNDKITLDSLIQFLTDKASMLEMIQANHSINNKGSLEQSKKPQKSHCLASVQNNKNKHNRTYTCSMCNGNHSLYSCSKFLGLSVTDRQSFVENKKLCKNCLRHGHAANDCYFGPCRKCNIKHNSLLHSECYKENALLTVQAETVQSTNPISINSAILNNNKSQINSSYECEKGRLLNSQSLQTVLLATALVEVAGKDDKYYKARALLDSGSQHCVITNTLRQILDAKTIQSTYQIIGVGQSVSQCTQMCKIKLRSLNDDYNTQIQCLVLPCLSTVIPTINIDSEILNIPQNLKLADPSFGTPSQIDLIIGADYFWNLILEGRIRLTHGPYLQNTRLGWIVSGPLYYQQTPSRRVQCNLIQIADLGEQLKRFWEIEEVSTCFNQYSDAERDCEKLFLKTTKRLNNGRFSVCIPLKETADMLGDSYDIAKTRFLSLERRLTRSPQLKRMYVDFMHEYLSLGHMTRIEHYTTPHYFLPHHGVLREQSVTTKLRVVFDASQKTTSEKSLNDIQHCGPPLQNDLFSILLRFRHYKYVACADIEKFFRQICIQEDQRNLQLILWRENPSDNLSVYQLNTVTYGTASAPYLSMRCVRQLGQSCDDVECSQTILNDLYVDDLITGHNNKNTLLHICKRVTEIFASACLPLRKWVFNSNDLASCIINSENTNNTKYLSLDDNYCSKTLGLGWFNNSDELYFTSDFKCTSNKVTKRLILSITSQIYDPLGLLGPFVITAKVLLQKLWLCKVDWDEIVPPDIAVAWEKLVNSLSILKNIRVPRHVIGDSSIQTELHIFTDASEVAYGACVYVRVITVRGDVIVRLLCAKSRVAPIKPVSIPRLELCGALLGAKLQNKIIKSLRFTFDKTIFWTDSTIVISWLKLSPRSLKTFVQNRVVEINDLTNNAVWLHVNGKNNPADLVSRGLTLQELNDSSLWWNGPTFLYDKVINMHQPHLENYKQSELPELKINHINITCTNNDFDFYRFSSFNRLHRAYTYMLRFIHNIKYKNKPEFLSGPLSIDELTKALIFIVKIVQQQSFADELNMLQNKITLKSSRNLASLNIFLDCNNIIRVGGRLTNSPDFTFDKKHPMLLCSNHYVTKLIFQYEHIKLLHAGPQLLLSHIRNHWWPIGGKNLAKLITRQCVKCARMKGKPIQPIMGNLPSERLEAGFPFLRCGVDYAGPFYILNRKGRGSRLEKCYLCLFICFSTRALHLELVTSLSSEYYILALKRFISRRGKPVQIFSDNGKNFVGAVKELSNFLQDSASPIVDYASNNGIKFSFIPLYSPHYGGLWEAGVKSCKHHMTRVIGNANLTYEEFSTVLVQIEAVLNSRPMYPLSSDPNDFSPLTPAHFLIGRPLTAPAGENVTASPLHMLSRYKRVEQLRQHFWKRWSLEYVGELQKRTKWQNSQGSLTPDALVVIKEDNLPPLKWRLGRIESVYPGRDGVSRVAAIRTAGGVIKRSTSKICPLPIA